MPDYSTRKSGSCRLPEYHGACGLRFLSRLSAYQPRAHPLPSQTLPYSYRKIIISVIYRKAFGVNVYLA